MNFFEISLPDILDNDNNFDSISFESSAFGKIDNSSTEASSETMIYDPEANALQLFVETEKYDLYKGTQEIQVTLMDEQLNSNVYTLMVQINSDLD